MTVFGPQIPPSLRAMVSLADALYTARSSTRQGLLRASQYPITEVRELCMCADRLGRAATKPIGEALRCPEGTGIRLEVARAKDVPLIRKLAKIKLES